MEPTEGMRRVLDEHPFFQTMSEQARGLIADCASNRVFNDGDRILKDGEAANVFYLVRRGAVALEVHVPGRAPLVVETLADGDVLGWSWLVPPYRVRFDARAIGLVRTLAIDARCLRSKCEEDCGLAYEFYKHFVPVIADRLTAARLQMLDMYGHPDEYAGGQAYFSEEKSAPAKPAPAEDQGDV
jgi:signal-transduction protein with cAMP-binding, CBS, and nucleotidyltransferase domain